MKLKVWYVSFDGRILGYFPDFLEACEFVDCKVDAPDDRLSFGRTSIIVNEHDFVKE